MGSLYCLHCNDCSNNVELCLGIGFRYYPENIFSKGKKSIIFDLVKDENIINDIKEYKKKGAVLNEDYGNTMYYCKECKTIEVKFYFSIKLGKEIYKPKYICKYCNKELEVIDENDLEYINSLEIKCTKCGGNNTRFYESGDWD